MSSTKGHCQCGEYVWELSGEPALVNAICHCQPCRRTGGLNGSVNLIVKQEDYKVTSGKTKNWTRQGDSGKDVTYAFCDNCCTVMSVEAVSLPGMLIVKTGTIDDECDPRGFLQAKPSFECYTKHRPGWVLEFDGLPQFEAVPTH